jgi:hypothetical protein
LKTKFYRVCRSGRTVDGREIKPEHIDQMAASYNPATYGARINVEHMRSMDPGGLFPALGDVVALKAETDAEGNRVLLAQVEPTAKLLEMNAAGQKVFWSAEINPSMPGTGGAYLMGLAVTDSPACLGTERMMFSLKRNPPPSSETHLFSSIVEGPERLEEEADATPAPPPTDTNGLFARVRELLTGSAKDQAARFKSVEESILALAEGQAKIQAGFDALSGGRGGTADKAALDKLRGDLDALIAKLSATTDNPGRPATTGGTGDTMTEF